jgi:hypothetical protein
VQANHRFVGGSAQQIVMAGLDPAIHVLADIRKKDVDARDI